MTIALGHVVVGEAEDFEHAVTRIQGIDLRGTTRIALRVGMNLWLKLLAKENDTLALISIQRKKLAERAPEFDLIIFVDGHDLASGIHTIDNAVDCCPRLLFSSDPSKPVFETISDDTLLELRQKDLESLISRSWGKCVFEPSAEFHFILPSGAHASKFFRLGDALTDLETIDRISFWLALNYLRDKADQLAIKKFCLVVDHPSTLVLAVRIQSMVPYCFSIHTLPSYPSDATSKQQSQEVVRALWQQYACLTVLVGITSTGRLSKFLENLALSSENTVDVAILYSAQQLHGASVLCNLQIDNYQHYLSEAECNLCTDKKSTPVAVNGTTYMVGNHPGKTIALPPKYFKAQKEFIEKFGKAPGVLRVHYDNPNDEFPPRHHAYYIDVRSLLKVDMFRSELTKHINNLPARPDLILLPEHPGSLFVGQVVKEQISKPTFRMKFPIERRLHDALLKHMASAKVIVVIDDMMLSGRTLIEFNRLFREHPSYFPMLERVFFIPLIANTESPKAMKAIKNSLTTQHSSIPRELLPLYEFPLPQMHEQDCPWCDERKALERLVIGEILVEGMIADRLTDLDATSAGLTDKVLLKLEEKVTGAPELGADSQLLYEGATLLQILLSCASAIQQCRDSDHDGLRANDFPVRQVLDQRVFTNYSERLIWLGLLRALRANELCPEAKKYLLDSLSQIDDQPSHRYIKGELAVAALLQKFGQIPTNDNMKQLYSELAFDWEKIVSLGYTN